MDLEVNETQTVLKTCLKDIQEDVGIDLKDEPQRGVARIYLLDTKGSCYTLGIESHPR